jgi:hypothetical protein
VNDNAVRIWVRAIEDVIADAQENLEGDQLFEFADLARERVRNCAPRGPTLRIAVPLEGTITAYIDAASTSDADRLRFWLRSDPDTEALVDQAVALVRRERERRNA